MAVEADIIIDLIKESFPDADINLEDLAGDNNHYALKICDQSFTGKSRIQQHQMVYRALKGKMAEELHALSISTSTPTA